jgi:hypothetical protein
MLREKYVHKLNHLKFTDLFCVSICLVIFTYTTEKNTKYSAISACSVQQMSLDWSCE